MNNIANFYEIHFIILKRISFWNHANYCLSINLYGERIKVPIQKIRTFSKSQKNYGIICRRTRKIGFALLAERLLAISG
jgi:hypothetical protein